MRIVLLAWVLALAGCTSTPPARGTAALTDPITTLSALISHVQDETRSCADARPASLPEFEQLVGPRLAELYQPFVKEWATCRVSTSYPRVGLVLLTDQRAFEKSWLDAMTAGKVSDGPSFSFGNGYAVTAGFLGISELGLYYLRCHYDDPRVRQIPADTEGCVYANPEHHHG